MSEKMTRPDNWKCMKCGRRVYNQAELELHSDKHGYRWREGVLFKAMYDGDRGPERQTAPSLVDKYLIWEHLSKGDTNS